MTFIEQIARYLMATGPCTTVELAKAMDVPTMRISGTLHCEETRRRWGITKELGLAERAGRGMPPNIWSIDKRKAHRFMLERTYVPPAVKPTPVRNAAPKPKVKPQVVGRVPKEVYRPPSKRPVYTGPMLTRWQPSSPYYKE